MFLIWESSSKGLHLILVTGLLLKYISDNVMDGLAIIKLFFKNKFK